MKKKVLTIACLASVMMFGTFFCAGNNAWAEEDESVGGAMSISISPVSKVLRLEADSTYKDAFKVTNNGDDVMNFEVYASPYSYTFSEADNEYKLGFSRENNYTQIVRWITFKDTSGNYVKNPHFSAEPGESVEIEYKISTPASIPSGGQYAVLFAHTLSSNTTGGGLRTEASPGLVVYGRADGETIATTEISGLEIAQTLGKDSEKKTIINATAKVKNTGNVDFMAYGKLKVEGVFGGAYYETPDTSGMVSIIPETELTVADQWEETPYFGLFKVTWTVSALESSETITKMVLLLPAPVIVAMILLLTIIIVWIIIMVRKRKERRARFAV